MFGDQRGISDIFFIGNVKPCMHGFQVLTRNMTRFERFPFRVFLLMIRGRGILGAISAIGNRDIRRNSMKMEQFKNYDL